MQVRCFIAVAMLLLGPGAASPQRGGDVPRRADGRGSGGKPCRPIEIEGTVAGGQSFRRPIGGGLDFLLEAVPQGWIVRVLPSSGARPEHDFAELATPPFRSMSPLLLTTDFGFRAQDVIGWNPRTFHYVATRSDFIEAQQAYRAATSAGKPTREQEMAVTRVVMKAREGRLEVLDAVLAPGTADQSAAAGLVSVHLAATPHSFRAPPGGTAGPLGKLLSVRFRVRLSEPGRAFCEGSTKSAAIR